jgi:hypothetical protein
MPPQQAPSAGASPVPPAAGAFPASSSAGAAPVSSSAGAFRASATATTTARSAVAATPASVGSPPKLHKPNYSTGPRPLTLAERINPRMIAFCVTILIIVGYPFYIWLQATLSHGIINHGDYSEVDLKAMSSFEMDQELGTLNDVPARWRGLDGKKVMLIGQPWAPHNAANGGVGAFQLCYSISQCCFKGPPKVQHFVDCRSPDANNGMDLPDTPMIRVFGTLHVNVIRGEGKVQSLYQLDVSNMEPES